MHVVCPSRILKDKTQGVSNMSFTILISTLEQTARPHCFIIVFLCSLMPTYTSTFSIILQIFVNVEHVSTENGNRVHSNCTQAYCTPSMQITVVRIRYLFA
jgi:hypothetical protein